MSRCFAMLGCAAPAAAQNLVLEPVAEGLDGAAASGGARRRRRTKIHRPAEWRCTGAWPGRPIDGRAVSRFAATTVTARAELRGARPAGLCPAPSVRPQRSRVCDLLGALAPGRARALEPYPPSVRVQRRPGQLGENRRCLWSGFCWRSTGPAANTMAAPSPSAPTGFSTSALATAAYRMASARRFSGRPSKFRRKR